MISCREKLTFKLQIQNWNVWLTTQLPWSRDIYIFFGLNDDKFMHNLWLLNMHLCLSRNNWLLSDYLCQLKIVIRKYHLSTSICIIKLLKELGFFFLSQKDLCHVISPLNSYVRKAWMKKENSWIRQISVCWSMNLILKDSAVLERSAHMVLCQNNL